VSPYPFLPGSSITSSTEPGVLHLHVSHPTCSPRGVRTSRSEQAPPPGVRPGHRPVIRGLSAPAVSRLGRSPSPGGAWSPRFLIRPPLATVRRWNHRVAQAPDVPSVSDEAAALEHSARVARITNSQVPAGQAPARGRPSLGVRYRVSRSSHHREGPNGEGAHPFNPLRHGEEIEPVAGKRFEAREVLDDRNLGREQN
jgi:hypothetical protein